MRELLWVGRSDNDIAAWPKAAQEEAAYQLQRLIEGWDPDDWKPMKTVGKTVREIRIHAEGEFRVIYVVKALEGIYVLHAFQKKTQRTPKRVIDLARQRLASVR